MYPQDTAAIATVQNLFPDREIIAYPVARCCGKRQPALALNNAIACGALRPNSAAPALFSAGGYALYSDISHRQEVIQTMNKAINQIRRTNSWHSAGKDQQVRLALCRPVRQAGHC